MAVIVSDLHIHYPGRSQAAVAGVSLHLQAGQMGVLIGPSGCGKTTLLRAIAGLEPVHAGTVHIDHQLVSSAQLHVPAEQRRIGMVFQDYALFPHLTVAGNVAFGLYAWSRPLQKARIAEVLDWVGLHGSEQRYPHELSGGQQQRVALARALAPKPHLLLLDEPFSNLDVDLRERLAKEVRLILTQAQTTALFVTHDQMEAFALGDVIGVMSHGRLEQWGDAYTLYHEPATRFVADFIGHGVFLPGQVRLEGGQRVAHTALGAWGVPPQTAMGECDVLFRADDIVHDDHAPLQAVILEKSFRGSEFLYTLRLASGEELMAHVPSHHDHRVGEAIGIRAVLDHVVTFAR